MRLFTEDAEVTSAEGVLYKGAQDQIRERYVKEFKYVLTSAIQPLSIQISQQGGYAAVSTDYKLLQSRFPFLKEEAEFGALQARLRKEGREWKIERALFSAQTSADQNSRGQTEPPEEALQFGRGFCGATACLALRSA